MIYTNPKIRATYNMGGEGSIAKGYEPPMHPAHFVQPIWIGSKWGNHPKQGPKVYHTGLNMYADSVDDFLPYWKKPEIGSEVFNLWVLYLYFKERNKYHDTKAGLNGPYSVYALSGINKPKICNSRAYLLIDKWYPGMQPRRDLIQRFYFNLVPGGAFVPLWWKTVQEAPIVGECPTCMKHKKEKYYYHSVCNTCGWVKEGHKAYKVITS